ncbi:mobilization protein, partial [human gut metagenome]
MGFVVLHMEKAHGSDSGTTAHIERFIIPKNADPTRTYLNRRLIDYPDRGERPFGGYTAEIGRSGADTQNRKQP